MALELLLGAIFGRERCTHLWDCLVVFEVKSHLAEQRFRLIHRPRRLNYGIIIHTSYGSTVSLKSQGNRCEERISWPV